MSVIPNKNLILFTSALKAQIGVIGFEERCKQTIESLQSIRKHFPDDIILFTDGSPVKVENEPIMREIAKYVNGIVCWDEDSDLQNLSAQGQKSAMETVMIFKMLIALKNNPELMRMMHDVKRIWKISSRTNLHDNFDAKEHDQYGKYVFKKRIASWLPKDRQEATTDHLLITRLYSFCPSLLDNYFVVLQSVFQDVLKYQIDTEHAHYKNIDKNYLFELDTVKCEGIVAGSGQLEKY